MRVRVAMTLFVLLFAWAVSADSGGLRQKLLLHLPLTNDFNDISGENRSVDYEGKIEIKNGAASFPGTGNWIETDALPFNKPFTVSMWIKVADTKSMYGLIEQRDSDAKNHHFHLMLRGSLQPYLGFYINDLISPISIRTNEWTHLVFLYNGTHQQIWINSSLVCQRAAKPYLGTKGVMRLGKSPNWTNVPAAHFAGAMRGVRIYGRALDPQDVSELYRIENRGDSSTQPSPEKTLPTSPSEAVVAPVIQQRPFLSIEGKELVISGNMGEIYILQATASLGSNWQNLATITNTTGTVIFSDGDADKYTERFYRIKVK